MSTLKKTQDWVDESPTDAFSDDEDWVEGPGSTSTDNTGPAIDSEPPAPAALTEPPPAPSETPKEASSQASSGPAPGTSTMPTGPSTSAGPSGPPDANRRMAYLGYTRKRNRKQRLLEQAKVLALALHMFERAQKRPKK